jgi:hypothetical protein
MLTQLEKIYFTINQYSLYSWILSKSSTQHVTLAYYVNYQYYNFRQIS